MTAKDSKARQLNRISSCIRDQIAVTPLLKYYACKISCNALRKISTSIGNQLQKKDLRWSSRNIGYRVPESSDKSPRNLRLLNIRTRANNVRSLFLNELCNFSTNSWAEDQRDTNELGFCAGRVVWVDPSSIMLGCSSVTRAIVPDRDAVAVRGLDGLSWAWFVAGFIPTSHLFSIDD